MAQQTQRGLEIGRLPRQIWGVRGEFPDKHFRLSRKWETGEKEHNASIMPCLPNWNSEKMRWNTSDFYVPTGNTSISCVQFSQRLLCV